MPSADRVATRRVMCVPPLVKAIDANSVDGRFTNDDVGAPDDEYVESGDEGEFDVASVGGMGVDVNACTELQYSMKLELSEYTA